MIAFLSHKNFAHRVHSSALRCLMVCGFVLSLSHCTSTTQIPQHPVKWQQHLQAINTLESWQLDAKIAVKAPKNNKSANFHWQQKKETFHIQLSGPFGQGAVIIKGNTQTASLEQSGEPPITAQNAESLLWQTTGWQLPFTQLSSWVRGIPDSHATVQHMSLNDLGLLEALNQEGWNIEYSRYRLVGQNYLPGRIVARSGDIKLIFAIHRWKLYD